MRRILPNPAHCRKRTLAGLETRYPFVALAVQMFGPAGSHKTPHRQPSDRAGQRDRLGSLAAVAFQQFRSANVHEPFEGLAAPIFPLLVAGVDVRKPLAWKRLAQVVPELQLEARLHRRSMERELRALTEAVLWSLPSGVLARRKPTELHRTIAREVTAAVAGPDAHRKRPRHDRLGRSRLPLERSLDEPLDPERPEVSLLDTLPSHDPDPEQQAIAHEEEAVGRELLIRLARAAATAEFRALTRKAAGETLSEADRQALSRLRRREEVQTLEREWRVL